MQPVDCFAIARRSAQFKLRLRRRQPISVRARESQVDGLGAAPSSALGAAA